MIKTEGRPQFSKWGDIFVGICYHLLRKDFRSMCDEQVVAKGYKLIFQALPPPCFMFFNLLTSLQRVADLHAALPQLLFRKVSGSLLKPVHWAKANGGIGMSSSMFA